ncbi:sec-independent translocase [Streptomyces calidiresistens]|uniref:Sec-independent protein translocase protein TatB n=1 Tax=Streptomyces calidiresistens TaxID=1485586 RepID=A0A7W3XX99_9ACTN|nr:sec-independent translocase [Streptomyces calidiresistens]MBB0230571.1 Sec-independent protein translocase TatB [Streptomyces calidiresistens]
MFFDIGSLEFIALIILAILVFGPDKLPKMIQDVAGFLRRMREFSDNAKRDIRNELGPEFKDFEFEDLNPRRFARKHLLERDELGLRELRDSVDVRKELTEVSDAVNGRTPVRRNGSAVAAGAAGGAAAGGVVSLGKAGDPPAPASGPDTGPVPPAGRPGGEERGTGPTGPTGSEPPPFDSDAT